jgi:hypothetical protein
MFHPIQWPLVYFHHLNMFNHKTYSYMIVLCALKTAAKDTSSLQYKRWKWESCRWEDGDWPSILQEDVWSSRMLYLPQYKRGNEDLIVLPRHTKVIVTGITGQSRPCRIVGCCQEGCWSWRLALAGESCFDYSGIPLKLCFSDWFFILNVAPQVNNVSWLTFLEVKHFKFQTSNIISMKFNDIYENIS